MLAGGALHVQQVQVHTFHYFKLSETWVCCASAILNLAKHFEMKITALGTDFKLVSTFFKLNLYSCCSNCTAKCNSCPLGLNPEANQMVNLILGLGGEKFK